MKKMLLFVSAFVSLTLSAQIPATVDFETVGTGSDWFVFENVNEDPAYTAAVDNPSKTGLNTSEKVGKLVVNEGGQPWAGLFSTTAIQPFTFDESNTIIKILVYKDVLSKFLLKFENDNGYAKEVGVVNTKTNEWEQLTFDFSAFIDGAEEITKLVIIPDFPDTRTAGSTNYFDFVDFGAGPNTAVAQTNANDAFKFSPNPAKEVITASAKAGVKVDIYNLSGVLVKSEVMQSDIQNITVAGLSSGLYIIRAGNDAQKLTIK